MQDKIRSITALITPFHEDGSLDLSTFANLIEEQIAAGTEGVVLAGTTGEGTALSAEERLALFELAVEVGKGKIVLLGSTGTNQTARSVAFTRKGKEIGLDGCLATIPYYNKPMPTGVIAHFSAIAEVGLPVIFYHHPGRTGTRLSVEVASTILDIPNVVAMKESTSDMLLTQELALRGYAVYSGDDLYCLAHLASGAVGSISVIGNGAPREWKCFLEAAAGGDLLEGKKAFAKLYPLIRALSLETNPQTIKYLVAHRGKCGYTYRLPLVAPMEATRDALEPFIDSSLCRL